MIRFQMSENLRGRLTVVQAQGVVAGNRLIAQLNQKTAKSKGSQNMLMLRRWWNLELTTQTRTFSSFKKLEADRRQCPNCIGPIGRTHWRKLWNCFEFIVWRSFGHQSCFRKETPTERSRSLLSNIERLHSSIGYVTPVDRLNGNHTAIQDLRDQKIKEARQKRPKTGNAKEKMEN